MRVVTFRWAPNVYKNSISKPPHIYQTIDSTKQHITSALYNLTHRYGALFEQSHYSKATSLSYADEQMCTIDFLDFDVLLYHTLLFIHYVVALIRFCDSWKLAGITVRTVSLLRWIYGRILSWEHSLSRNSIWLCGVDSEIVSLVLRKLETEPPKNPYSFRY